MEHDLFRKPVSTFRDHALGEWCQHEPAIRSVDLKCNTSTRTRRQDDVFLPPGNAIFGSSDNGRKCAKRGRPRQFPARESAYNPLISEKLQKEHEEIGDHYEGVVGPGEVPQVIRTNELYHVSLIKTRGPIGASRWT